MRRIIVVLTILVLAALAGTASASAAKRVALVIGIDAYDNLPTLQKAVNDEKAVAAALAELGFDVLAGENLTRREMNAKLAELDGKIAPGDTVFFYFAGHGVALGAENYLLPRDLPKPRNGEENLVRDEGHAVDAIVRRVQGRGAAVSFFVLDACRDNPLAASGVRSIGGTRGLTRVDTPNGVFVLFSAGLGQTALDRLGDNDPDPNSVFTRELVPLLKTPGLTQVSLAKRVQREVDKLAASVRHPQQPAYYDQIIGEIELSPAAAAGASPLAPAADVNDTKVAIVTPPRPEVISGHKAGDTFKDCDQCPEMVVLPPGEFTMGSPAREKDRYHNEGPQHAVRIPTMFAIGKFEVTRDQFETFVGDTGHVVGSSCKTYTKLRFTERRGRSYRNPDFPQEATHPVVCVSWDDAKAYVDWLSQKTGKNYRLLTEAEWEYAARSGSTSRFAFGDSETKLCAHNNGGDITLKAAFGQDWDVAKCKDGYVYTSPVGTFLANGFGLHDMQGNAAEWVEDCYHDTFDGAPSDGSAWTTGDCSSRVYRGGAWLEIPMYQRSAHRNGTEAEMGVSDIGFRVARTLTP